jgi:hypothetical protein
MDNIWVKSVMLSFIYTELEELHIAIILLQTMLSNFVLPGNITLFFETPFYTKKQ